MKKKLTIKTLKKAAQDFCDKESTYSNKDLYGVTDGKAVGTYIEHKFQNYLDENYEYEKGSSAKGIDLPSNDILTDINANQILAIEEGSTVSAVEVATNETPSKFSLSQNYPNPFNPTTTIAFDLAQPGHVRLDVYSILGQHVKTLVDEYKSQGTHRINMNARQMAAGVYIYRLKANGFEMQKKMILLK